MAEKAVTTSQSKGGQHGGPQLFPVLRSTKGEAEARSEEAQKQFLSIMGFTAANIPIEEVGVFTDEEAEEITLALSHFTYDDEELVDPYFTPNEWERHFKRARTILSEIRELNKTESIHEKCDELSLQCKCQVHTAVKMEWVLNLLDVSEPMTDSDGLRLAQCLIPEILKRGGGSLPSLYVEECRSGAELKTIDYILRLPSGASVHFSGGPDFSVLYKLTPTALRRKRRRLYGVGEVQSKPATRKNDNKTATMAQAGIYGVGELTKVPHDYIVVVVLFKDKSAQVALASRSSAATPMSGGLGEVSFKYIERVYPMCLKEKDGLQAFSRILVSTLKWISASTSH